MLVATLFCYGDENTKRLSPHAAEVDLGRQTLILEEIAHARPPGENKLGDILDDFGFLFR